MKEFLMPLLLICLCILPLAVFSQSVISNIGGDRPSLINRPPQGLESMKIKAALSNIGSQQSLIFQNQRRSISLNAINTEQKTVLVTCCFATIANGAGSPLIPLPYSAISIEHLSMPKVFEGSVRGFPFITASKVSASQPLAIDNDSMLSQSIVDSVVSTQPLVQPSVDQSPTYMSPNQPAGKKSVPNTSVRLIIE